MSEIIEQIECNIKTAKYRELDRIGVFVENAEWLVEQVKEYQNLKKSLQKPKSTPTDAITISKYEFELMKEQMAHIETKCKLERTEHHETKRELKDTAIERDYYKNMIDKMAGEGQLLEEDD